MADTSMCGVRQDATCRLFLSARATSSVVPPWATWIVERHPRIQRPPRGAAATTRGPHAERTIRKRTCAPSRERLVLLALIGCAGFLPDCRKTESEHGPSNDRAVTPWFEEVADEVGLSFRHVSGHQTRHWFPEIMSGGVCLLDYDNDGDLDVYLVQAGNLNDSSANRLGNQLYRNRGNGVFENVTAQARVGDTNYGMGCACGDFDGDGYIDLYVTNVGPNVLYRNNGDGTFAEVTKRAGVGDASWSSSAAFADYDEDGRLDLFVANYVGWTKARELDCVSPDGRKTYCSPLSYKARSSDTLYRNLGDGRFVDASAPSGIAGAVGNGLGVVAADLTGDNHVDFFVANDEMENHLWVNLGDGRFAERALPAGCAVNEYGTPEAGMGVAAVDIENDGDLDLFLSHMNGQTNTLYLNHLGSFEDVTAKSGLAAPSLIYTSYGLGFADFDQDTRLDLYVVGGRMTWRLPLEDPGDAYAEPNQLFRGKNGGRFEEVVPRGGTAKRLLGSSRGAAFGDLDNDGDIDIVINNIDGPAHVLRNVVEKRGGWITFRVLDEKRRDAVGAMVRIETEGGVQWRLVQPAYGYCTSNDPRVHFGIGSAARIERATVRWPDGREESFGPFDSGKIYKLRRNSGR